MPDKNLANTATTGHQIKCNVTSFRYCTSESITSKQTSTGCWICTIIIIVLRDGAQFQTTQHISYLLHFFRLLATTFLIHNHATHDTYVPTHAFPRSRAQSFTLDHSHQICIMILTSYYERVHKTGKAILFTAAPQPPLSNAEYIVIQ